MQVAARFVEDNLAVPHDPDALAGHRGADDRREQSGVARRVHQRTGIAAAHLQHRAQFLGEQRGQRIRRKLIERHVESAAAANAISASVTNNPPSDTS